MAKDLAGAQTYALGLLLVAVLGAGSRIASRLLIFNAGRDVEYDIRSELFVELAKRPPSFFQEITSGQVMSRAINDLTQVRLLLGPGLLNLAERQGDQSQLNRDDPCRNQHEDQQQDAGKYK